eukprot:scaffold37925_cov174-Skeletonema_marinoi.AAC.1
MRLYLHLFVFVLSTTTTAAAAVAEGNADVADNNVEDDSSRLTPLQLPPPNNDNESDQEQDGGAASGTDTDPDPITAALDQIIRQSLSELKKYPSVTNIVIDNEIINNSFIDSVEDGVVFSPNIGFHNDMHGFLVGNNNAESETGNVKRQNGVADFRGALKGNNNAYSEAGDVVRQNGVMAADYDYEQDADADEDALDAVDVDTDHVLPPPSRRLKHGQESESEANSEDDGSSTSWAEAGAEDDKNRSESRHLGKVESDRSLDFDYLDNAIITRNISGNTVTKTKQKGLIGTPQISIINDMSNSFHDNNNAKSVEGKVEEQNLYGVAEIRDALQNVDNSFTYSEGGGLVFSPNIEFNNDMRESDHGNNNAESHSGNVKWQNGVADFQGALKNSNNVYSDEADVIRHNDVIAGNKHDTDEDALLLPPPSRHLQIDQESDSLTDKDDKREHSTKEDMNKSFDQTNNTLTIRNKISGNTVTKTRQKGIIVTPQITFVNDMSDSFQGNNNARSVDGDVVRQNGVADFQDALQENNNAFSVEGDVTRQNGILGLPSGSGGGGG